MVDNDRNKGKKEKGSNKKLILVLLIFVITFLGFGVSISVMNGIKRPAKDNVINNIIAIDREDDPGDDDDGKDDNKDDEGGETGSKIIFSYYENPGVGNGIDLYNQFPVSDEVGKAFKGDNYVFEFKLILNKRSVGIKYNIVAERLEKSTLRNELVKIYLESDNKPLSSVFRNNGSVKTFNEFSDYEKANQKEKVIYTGVITKEEARRGYKNFVFKMWISDGVTMTSDDFQKTFKSRINVYANGDL